MELELQWHKSLKLTGKFPSYKVDEDAIPSSSGIYVFLRKHGESADALYIGKASNLKSRIIQQFNNLKLMRSVDAAPTGERRLFFAEFISKPGQQEKKALPICEKALIRFYLSQGHSIVNDHGTRLNYHEITSHRSDLKKFLPTLVKLQIG